MNLKDYDIQLEPDIQYRWYLRIARKPESRPQDVVVAGLIARCGEEDCQVRDMPSQCDRDFVRVLAIRGFWTDSMSCLCDLIKSSPDDETLRQLLDYYMWQAGLTLDSR